MKAKVIPKKQRIAIYKEAIEYIYLNKHCESGLCILFDGVAEDLGYTPKSYDKSNYYFLELYPEMPKSYKEASKNGYYHGKDHGFSNRRGREKRLHLLKQIVNKLENENKKTKSKTIS